MCPVSRNSHYHVFITDLSTTIDAKEHEPRLSSGNAFDRKQGGPG